MPELLDRINSPGDLRLLRIDELPQLAREIREELVSIISEVGGHFASTLGVVELTLALHYAFDTPEDRLVWDTGHQAYAHKIICGRRRLLPTIRQAGGLSGFLSRKESEYDVFGAGHAGTGVSSALGIASALSDRKLDHQVVAVVSDGALTAGLTFEGLNHAGFLRKNLIVVLNDNSIFIDARVGALSACLSKASGGDSELTLKRTVEQLLDTFPAIAEENSRVRRKLKDVCPGSLTPGFLFEALGFLYVGPVDGYNFGEMIRTFRSTKMLEGPALIHVITRKGEGYRPAEENPVRYHSVSPFHVLTGKAKKEKSLQPTYTEVFARALIRLARENPRVVAITAAMASGTGLDKFLAEFPDRGYDVGLAEQHAVTFAAGLAAEGLIPVVAIYSTFLQRAYDQIVHDVCLQNLHVVFALDRGGLVGADGPTHHGVFDFAYMRHIPNMVVMAPMDENELQHMLKTAIDYSGPISFRYPRGDGWGVNIDSEMADLEIGKGQLMRRGKDLAIVAAGQTVVPAVRAAEDLATLGIDAAVVNMRFLKPLDRELLLQTAVRVPYLITVEDHALEGGLGSAVVELVSDHLASGPRVKRLGIPDRFISHGTQDELRRICGIDQQAIFQAAIQMLQQKKSKLAGNES